MKINSKTHDTFRPTHLSSVGQNVRAGGFKPEEINNACLKALYNIFSTKGSDLTEESHYDILL